MPHVYIANTTTPDLKRLDLTTLSEPANGQGVAYDGTYHYFSDSFDIHRYTRNPSTGVYTYVDSTDVTGDDPVSKTQINDMTYYDGYLWCGANNWPAEDGGWIVQYDVSDMSWVDTFDVQGKVNEGGAWRIDPVHGPEYWSVYSAYNKTIRWRLSGGNFVEVDEYALPLVVNWVYSAGTSSIYDGAAWLGDYFICHAKGDGNLQLGIDHQETQLHIHYWNGTAFEATNTIFTGVVSAGQGIHFETAGEPTINTPLLIAMRSPQQIMRCKIMSLT